MPLFDVEEVLAQFQADRRAAAAAERAAAAAEAAAAAAEAAEAAGEAAPVPEPAPEEEAAEEPLAVAPLDTEGVREAIAAVTAREVAPRGFVLVLPEVPLPQPTPKPTPQPKPTA